MTLTHTRVHVQQSRPQQRRQLQEDIIPQLASEPEQAAKLLLEELPKIAQRTVEALPKNPKDVRACVRTWGRFWVWMGGWMDGWGSRPSDEPPAIHGISIVFTQKTKQLVETVREIGSSLPSEARNVFLRTPEGLETPHFHLLYEGDGVRWRLALVD